MSTPDMEERRLESSKVIHQITRNNSTLSFYFLQFRVASWIVIVHRDEARRFRRSYSI
jgi:hypothetical protein